MKKLTARDYNIILRAVNGAREVFEAVSGYPLSIAYPDDHILWDDFLALNSICMRLSEKAEEREMEESA